MILIRLYIRLAVFFGFLITVSSYATHLSGHLYCTARVDERWQQSASMFKVTTSRYNGYMRQADFHQISMHDVHVVKNKVLAAAQKFNDGHIEQEFLRFIEKANQLSIVELQARCDSLREELRPLMRMLQVEQTVRSQLLQLAELPQVTRTLSAEQEKILPNQWQHAYLNNMLCIKKLEFAIAVKEKCLQYSQKISLPRTASLNNAVAQYRGSIPNAEHCPILEEEVGKLEHSLHILVAQEKALIKKQDRDRKELIEKELKIDELDHWYKLLSGSKLAGLRKEAKDLRDKISERQKTISGIKQTRALSEADLQRLRPALAYAQQCREDLKKIHGLCRQVADNNVLTCEDKAMFEALTETIRSQAVSGEIVCELTKDGKELLAFCGVDVEAFQTFIGNSVQKALAQKLCGIVNRTGKNFIDERDTIVRPYIEATLHSCSVASEMIRHGKPYEAFAWTKLSYALERAANVAMNMARGITNGMVNIYDTRSEMSLNPEYVVKELRGVAVDLVNIIRGDKNVLSALKSSCLAFVKLPASAQAQHAMTMLTSFIMPGQSKLNSLACFSKSMKSIGRVMQSEAAALEHLDKIVASNTIIINGVAVPEHFAGAVNDLVKAGRLVTTQDIKAWIEFVQAPLTSSWKNVVQFVAEQASGLRSSQAGRASSTSLSAGHLEIKHDRAAQQERAASADFKIAAATSAQAEVKEEHAGHFTCDASVTQGSSVNIASVAADIELAKAIEKTGQESGVASTFYCPLEQATVAALASLGIDAKKEFDSQYTGTYVQQHIHKKFIVSLNRIGTISQSNPEVQRLLRGAVVLNKTGQNLNNQHHLKQALSAHHACDMVINYAKTVADLGVAVGEGVFAGVKSSFATLGKIGKGALDAVTFPEETLLKVKDSFNKASLAMSRFVAVVREDMALMAKADPTSLQELTARREARGKLFDAFTQALSQKLSDRPLRDQVKAVVQFFTECECLGGLGEVFCESAALQRTGGVIVEEMVLCPQQALAEEVVLITARTIDIEPAVVQGVIELAQKDTTFLAQVKSSSENISKQFAAFFDRSLDAYDTSPGFLNLGREVVAPKVSTYEQARNKALEIIGKVDFASSEPHIGRLGVGKGKVVGRKWHGNKVSIRLDWDAVKGPHINVTDYRLQKGSGATVVAIPFEGDLGTVESLLKHLQ